MDSIVKLDTRGRLVIPNEFREALDLKEGDTVLLTLDRNSNTISISPVYGNQNDLVNINLLFGDFPGGLAVIAEKLAELKVDLIMTESKSFQRGEKARWDIIADISRTGLNPGQIQKILIETKQVESASVSSIAGGQHHN